MHFMKIMTPVANTEVDRYPSSDGYKLWVKYKPQDLSWYGVDLEITSKETGVFSVYRMASLAYGGRGALETKIEVEFLVKELKPYISDRIRVIATREIANEDEEIREKRIQNRKEYRIE